MKTIIIFILIMAWPLTASAELSEAALKSIGQFLVMDFLSVSGKQKNKPITDTFIVKETDDEADISKEEISSLHGLEGVRNIMSPGKYREIVITNEVTNLGGIVRKAFINENNQVFWSNHSQSLLRYERRPELGNTGVLQLMQHDPNNLSDLFRNAQRGTIPIKWKPSKKNLKFYVSSINAMEIIFLNRW